MRGGLAGQEAVQAWGRMICVLVKWLWALQHVLEIAFGGAPEDLQSRISGLWD
jgi:hypothetical protein